MSSPDRRCPSHRKPVDGDCSDGQWSYTAADGFVYTPTSSGFVRLTAEGVRHCLRGRHLLFFGDSVQRYFYLVLASFLITGEWPKDATSVSEPSICYEGPWRQDNASYAEGWRRYFAEASPLLRGHEICDCWRGEACCDEAQILENRFTSARGSAVSFVSHLGRANGGITGDPLWQPHGTVPLGSFDAMRGALKCAPGECHEVAWQMDARAFMRRGLPKLGVTDVVINSGQHWTSLFSPDNTRFVHDLFAAAAQGALRRAWWRTTTPRFKGALKPTTRKGMLIKPTGVGAHANVSLGSEGSDAARQHGLGVIDLFEVVMRLRHLRNRTLEELAFVDGVHLSCSVQRELLLIMLDAVCRDQT
jgi:hypothetical protein